MILLWGALAGVAAMHVYDLARDWWNARRDLLVDERYPRMCSALGGLLDAVEVPSFHIVMPPSSFYDQDAEGAA